MQQLPTARHSHRPLLAAAAVSDPGGDYGGPSFGVAQRTAGGGHAGGRQRTQAGHVCARARLRVPRMRREQAGALMSWSAWATVSCRQNAGWRMHACALNHKGHCGGPPASRRVGGAATAAAPRRWQALEPAAGRQPERLRTGPPPPHPLHGHGWARMLSAAQLPPSGAAQPLTRLQARRCGARRPLPARARGAAPAPWQPTGSDELSVAGPAAVQARGPAQHAGAERFGVRALERPSFSHRCLKA